MARRVHSESANLDWTIRRIWLPEGLRLVGIRQIYSGSHQPLHNNVGALFSPLFTLVFGVPALLVLIPLRFANLVGWRIEAVTRPWGRLGPATMLAWRVKGWAESERAMEEIASSLERGETDPQISFARRDE